MVEIRYLLVFFGLIWHQLAAQSRVFTSGEEGYQVFRIPAIIQASNGDLLAFAEGRVNGGADFGDIDLVMKRSTNKGATWSDLHVVLDVGNLQAGNPGPVVDLLDPQYPNGRILLFYNEGDNHEGEVRKGLGTRRVKYITSTDNGISWSTPIDISHQVHKLNSNGNKEDWRSYAITPGHTVQASDGKYKGRIFVAANHSAGEPQSDWSDYRSHGFYTDDHGKTFQLSPSLSYPGSNEATAAYLNDKLVLNARDQSGKTKRRIMAISQNGGESWSEEYVDSTLIDPVNQGSLLLLADGKSIAFSNAHDTHNRNNLCIQLSKDEGKSWYKKILVDTAEDNQIKRSYTAYSDLVNLSQNSVGILYERNAYKEIVFKEIKW